MKIAEHKAERDFVEDPQSPTSETYLSDDDAFDDDTFDDQWQVRARQRYEHARAWVRENPLPAIGIAVATGFVAGRIFRR